MSIKHQAFRFTAKAALASILGVFTPTFASQASPISSQNCSQADSFVWNIASKKTAANDFMIRKAEAQMRQAVDKLQDTDEFKQAVEKNDSRALSRMIQKEAGVELPTWVKIFRDDATAGDRKWHVSIQVDGPPLHATITITH